MQSEERFVKVIFWAILALLLIYFLKLMGLLELVGIDPEMEVLLWLAGGCIGSLLGSQALIFHVLNGNIKVNREGIEEVRKDVSNIKERVAKIEGKLN